MLASETRIDRAPDRRRARADRASAERRCLVTRAVQPKERMLRFVVDPGGVVVPDLAETLPGRGLWLTAERDIVAAASARNLFARAARASVTAPDDLADRVEALLLGRLLDGLGLARRAGQVAIGFETAREALRSGRVAVLLTASDAADGGARKLKALAPAAARVDLLASGELGQAFGREHIVHATVAAGRLAEKVRRDAGRLAGFRAGFGAGFGSGETENASGEAEETNYAGGGDPVSGGTQANGKV